MKQHSTTTPHTGNAKFGEALRKLRKTADMSIVDLAKSVGVDQTLLSRIETGAKHPPELGTLMRIANVLGIPQGSDEFEELWRLAEQERNPGADAAAYIDSMKDLTATVLKELLEDLTKDNTANSDDMPVMPMLPVFVKDVTALVAKSTEEVARRGATAITVRFADGTSKTWRVVGTTPSQEQRDV
jgi:transcriptional regulator with XRE-family HTH domain